MGLLGPGGGWGTLHPHDRWEGVQPDGRAILVLPAYLDLPSDRDEALAGTTAEQYEALAQRFRQVIEL